MSVSHLRLLLSRLSWPSVMVRERAASALAGLMVNAETRDEVVAALLDWMAHQKFESTAALGVVVLIRARDTDANFTPPTEADLDKALIAPSLLSYLLRADLLQCGGTVSGKLSAPHSGDAAPDFSPNPLFTQHADTYVPQIFRSDAHRIEERLGVDFLRQWAYETDYHLRLAGITLPYFTHNHWMTGDPTEYAPHTLPIAEAYRSGYLRTVAWAVDEGHLSNGWAIHLVMHTCPLDLALWSLQPQPKPDWWPFASQAGATVDTMAPLVWQAINKLWEARTTIFGSSELAYADGSVGMAEGVGFEFQMILLCQRARGPKRPEPNAMQEKAFEHAQYPSQDSPLRYIGRVRLVLPDDEAFDCDDWAFVPVAIGAPPSAIPFWQSWRMPHFVVWLPAGYITGTPLNFTCSNSEHAVEVESEGKVIAKWQDWNEGVTERRHPKLPVQRGSYLLIDRECIDRFAEKNGASLCWLCRLNIYSPTSTHDYNVKITPHAELLGGTPIVRI